MEEFQGIPFSVELPEDEQELTEGDRKSVV